jgi:hypothetical protein
MAAHGWAAARNLIFLQLSQLLPLADFVGECSRLLQPPTSAIGIAAATAGHPVLQGFMGAVQFGASIFAVWLCAFMADSFWVYHLHHASGRA